LAEEDGSTSERRGSCPHFPSADDHAPADLAAFWVSDWPRCGHGRLEKKIGSGGVGVGWRV